MDRASWVIGLALLCCLISGCTTPTSSPGPSPTQTVVPTTGSGISDITPGMTVRSVNLSTALADLENFDTQQLINVSELKIHQLNGIGMNDKGEAQIWVLGADNDPSSTLLIYTGEEWRTVDWQGTLPREEIDITGVISPDALYAAQSKVIGQALARHKTGVSNLELLDSVYTVTISSSGSITVLSFNAATGELLSAA